MTDESIVNHGISEFKFNKLVNTKSGEKQYQLSALYKFNTFGKTINYQQLTKKNKLQYNTSFTYNSDSLLVKTTQEGLKKKDNFQSTYEYNENKFLVVYRIYNNGHTSPDYANYTYYTGKKVSKQEYFEDGKLKSFMLFSYFPDGSIEKTQRFNGKGKLLKIVSYECKPEGALTKSSKDTLRVCRYEKYDDEGLIYKITEYPNHKNQLTKRMDIYNRDTVLIEHRYYIKDTLLLSKTKYLHEKNVIRPKITDYFYYVKGKLKRYKKYSFDEYNRQTGFTETEYKGGKSKIVYTISSIYDEKGLPIKTTTINRKGEIVEFIYEFSYFGK